MDTVVGDVDVVEVVVGVLVVTVVVVVFVVFVFCSHYWEYCCCWDQDG